MVLWCDEQNSMSTNYKRGYTFELEVKHTLEDVGFCCIRSAGSHGAIDILAGKDDGDTIWAVQCKKNGIMSAEDWANLKKDADKFSAIPLLATKLRGGYIEFASERHDINYTFKPYKRQGTERLLVVEEKE